MSREKEIRKMLKEKQRETDKLLQELNRTRYSKQLDVFCNTLSASDELLQMVIQNNFTCEDAKILAQKLLINMNKLYQHYKKDFDSAAARRTQKNEAKAASRARKVEVQVQKTMGSISSASTNTDAEQKIKADVSQRRY